MNLKNIELLSKFSKGVTIVAALVLAIAVFAGIFQSQVREQNGKILSNDIRYPNDSVVQSSGGVSNMMGAAPEPVMDKIVREGSTDATMMSEGSIDASVDVSATDDRRVVRDGALSLRVEDAEWSADEIGRIAERFGGFVVSRTMRSEIPGYPMPMVRDEWSNVGDMRPLTTGTPESGTIVVKVPSESFSEVMASIRGIAKVVLNESSSANDVTATYVDLEAQLKNKYAEEEAFTKILNTSAQKVSDILEVTRELSRVRGEIERLETGKKYLESQTDMASITVSLSEDVQVGSVSNDWRPWQTVKDAANQLLLRFRGFIDGVIYLLVSVLPLFLLYLLGIYVIYKIGKGMYRKVWDKRKK